MRPKLYAELADWWSLVSPDADYAEEARLYASLLGGGGGTPKATALELGSGGGHCALHMREQFDWTLTDVSPEMLQQSRKLQPERPHELGDMRSLRLGRTFDAVFVHDAVMYMTTEADLAAACATAFAHCRPGGTALFAPDWTEETFAPGTDHGGADAPGRSLRYLEWVHEASGTKALVDFVFLLHEGAGSRVVHDRHEWGVFPLATWLELLRAAGFSAGPRVVRDGEGERCLFVATRPR